MKHTTVPDKASLRKRVHRFFQTTFHYRKEVADFVNELTSERSFRVYAFGGLIRDIGLFGVRTFSSDVDLVFDGPKSELEAILNAYSCSSISKNKFGGFRLKLKAWDVDIWCAEDTWAVKEGLVEYKNINSLLDTTLLSWDAVLFDVTKHQKKKLICRDGYLDDLLYRKIDVVLSETPNRVGSLVRLMRAVPQKDACILGKNAIDFMNKSFASCSVEDLMNYEVSSYSTRYLSPEKINDLSTLIRDYAGESELRLQSNFQFDFAFDDYFSSI